MSEALYLSTRLAQLRSACTVDDLIRELRQHFVDRPHPVTDIRELADALQTVQLYCSAIQIHLDTAKGATNE